MLFVEALPEQTTQAILSSMVADGYHKMPAFQNAFKTFARQIAELRDVDPEEFLGVSISVLS